MRSREIFISAVFGPALFTASFSICAETAIPFEKVLAAAKKQFSKKDEFETNSAHLSRIKINCESNSSILCRPLFIDNPLHGEYDLEMERIKYRDPFEEIGLRAEVGYWQPPFEQQYCASYKVYSRREKSQALQNYFGAIRYGIIASVHGIGVVFLRREVAYTPGTSITYQTCTNQEPHRISDGPISYYNQGVNISREAARVEKGKFLVRLEGIPMNPYYAVVGRDTGRNFSEVDQTIFSMEAVIITPTRWKIIGKESGKIYAEGNFPNSENR